MTPFPVFTADKNGLVLYKNKAAVRYIGTMRKGSRIARHLTGEGVPESEKIVHIKGETPYPNALVLADEEKYLFLCFSRLQYPDFESVAEEITDAFGRTPSEIFHTFEEYFTPMSEDKRSIRRIYTELIGRKPLKENFGNKPYSLGSLAEKLFAGAEDGHDTLFAELFLRICGMLKGNSSSC